MPSYVATVSSSLMRVLWPAHSAKFDLPNGGVGFVTSFASTCLVLLIARRGADAAAVRDGLIPGCNTCSALCCESSGNQQLSGPPGAGVLPATNQLTGERSEPKSWGQIGAVNVV